MTIRQIFEAAYSMRDERVAYDFRMCTPRGERWLNAQARIVYDADGRPAEVYGVNFDVTDRRLAAEALADRNRQLHLLARTSQQLVLSERDEHDGIDAVFAEIGAAIGMESWFHFRVEAQDPTLLTLYSAGGVSDAERRAFRSLRFGELLCGQVAESRDLLIVEDLQASAQPGCDSPVAAGVRCYVGFPLLVRGELVGTLAYVSRERTHLREGDVQLIQTLCDPFAATIDWQRLLRNLEQSDRQKDRFVATLSHELRNPLAPIRTAAELLAAPGVDDEQIDWARGVIQRQVGHVALLLDDLLDLARITQRKLELRRESVTPPEIVESAVEAARPLIERKGHRLQLDLQPDLPAFEADLVRLSQVISNLLTNSAKYTESGGDIVLRARLDDGD